MRSIGITHSFPIHVATAVFCMFSIIQPGMAIGGPSVESIRPTVSPPEQTDSISTAIDGSVTVESDWKATRRRVLRDWGSRVVEERAAIKATVSKRDACIAASVSKRGACQSTNGLIRKKGVISNAFTQEVQEALKSVPVPIQKALEKAGYTVVLCQSVPSAVPDARYQKVRGYSAHTSWSEVAGMFDRRNKRVVLAEQGREHGKPVTPERRVGILRHEIGHAFDNYLGNFSHSPAFKRAYASAAAKIPAAEKEPLSYYLQPGSGGIEETFAELFASCSGQGCDRAIDQLLHKRFPSLVAMIENVLARYQV